MKRYSPKIKLICVPYAGGDSYSFYKLKPFLSKIELCTVELAAHGKRIDEAFYPDLYSAAIDVINQIKMTVMNEDYILLGHSMGSYIVYEVEKIITKEKLRQPLHIFLSGSGAPGCGNMKLIHKLPDSEFQREIMKYGETPLEIFEDEKLRSIFVPILKSDYRIVEEYKPTLPFFQIPCPVTIFLGTLDDTTLLNNALKWSDFTSCQCDYKYFEGNHFFINHLPQCVADSINVIVNEYLEGEIYE